MWGLLECLFFVEDDEDWYWYCCNEGWIENDDIVIFSWVGLEYVCGYLR